MGFLRLIFENSFFSIVFEMVWNFEREKMCNRRLDCVVRKIMPAPDSFVLRNQTNFLSFVCIHHTECHFHQAVHLYWEKNNCMGKWQNFE